MAEKLCDNCGAVSQNPNNLAGNTYCNHCLNKLRDLIYTSWMTEEPKEDENE